MDTDEKTTNKDEAIRYFTGLLADAQKALLALEAGEETVEFDGDEFNAGEWLTDVLSIEMKHTIRVVLGTGGPHYEFDFEVDREHYGWSRSGNVKLISMPWFDRVELDPRDIGDTDGYFEDWADYITEAMGEAFTEGSER